MESLKNIRRNRFANIEEIIESTQQIDIRRDDNEYGGIPVLYNGYNWLVLGRDENSLIVSDPGGGKSTRIATELIMSNASAGHSMFITDCKGELFCFTKSFLESKGYEIRCINFVQPELGDDTWNPLYLGAKYYKDGRPDKAAEIFADLADALYARVHSEKDPFWELSASNLLVSICLLLCKEVPIEEVTLSLAYSVYIEGFKKIGGQNYFKQYLEEIDDKTLYEAFAGIISSPSETLNSILSVFSSTLQKLVVNRDVADLMSGNTIIMEDFIEKKTAVFILFRDESSVYNPVISSFIHQTYTQLIDIAREAYGELPRTVDYVLDEFSNLTKINEFRNKISACRSRNIRMHLFVQSLNQLEITYGKEAITIMGCCQNWFYLHSPELSMLKLFSIRCGNVFFEHSQTEIPLLSISDLQHLSKEKGEVLCLIGRNYPFITTLPHKSAFEGIVDDFVELKKFNFEPRKKHIKSKYSFCKRVEKMRQDKMDKLNNDTSKLSDIQPSDISTDIRLFNKAAIYDDDDGIMNTHKLFYSFMDKKSGVNELDNMVRRGNSCIYRLQVEENHSDKLAKNLVIISPEDEAAKLDINNIEKYRGLVNEDDINTIKTAKTPVVFTFDSEEKCKNLRILFDELAINSFYCQDAGLNPKEESNQSFILWDGTSIGAGKTDEDKKKSLILLDTVSKYQNEFSMFEIMKIASTEQLIAITLKAEDVIKIHNKLNYYGIASYLLQVITK